MPQIRNFFPKRPAVNLVPAASDPPVLQNVIFEIYHNAAELTNPLQISPSPTEKKSFWRKPSSQNNTRSLVDENEPFPISRESFDSYRRSFDICARSPVSQSDSGLSRTSFESRLSRPTTTPRSTISGYTFDPPSESPHEVRGQQQEHEDADEQDQEQFVDIGLNDDAKLKKKKGFLARLGDNVMTASMPTPNTSTSTAAGTGTGGVEAADNNKVGSSHLSLGFHLPGRKREQSDGAGTGAGAIQVAELGSLKIPVMADAK
ncbi:conserved hypothetical protein [Histoplasma capsulatum H143]|uniref:Uncharacterized protein n=1 Tax=Ajellomyces capsulatus (strain H143) TaxID=544712 RepID=C6H9C2_AJECH|nr:conserved hypothetical protein [Histoplasma capsulatum H143]